VADAAAPEELEEGSAWATPTAACVPRRQGTLMCGCYGKEPRLIPEKRMKEFQPPPTTIERIPAGRMDTKKTGRARARRQAASSLRVFRSDVRSLLLGNLAVRFPDQRLLWDGRT